MPDDFPLCAEAWPGWRALAAAGRPDPAAVPDWLAALAADGRAPPFLADVARIDLACAGLAGSPATPATPEEEGGAYRPSPGLQLLRLSWRVAEWAQWPGARTARAPLPGEEWALVWHDRWTGARRIEPAGASDLLALKMVAEDLGAGAIGPGNDLIGAHALRQAAGKGILLGRSSAIRRRGPALAGAPARFAFATRFTLQWHLTSACDLRCRHCYDRSARGAVSLDEGLRVLDDLQAFCEGAGVLGDVAFTGGNPLLHPHLEELVGAADRRGFYVSILGNPAPRARLERLLAVARPEFYQVSLEGLEPRCDAVRGPGSFRRALAFLQLLRDLGVRAVVMLTVTRDNLQDVLPLARLLEGRADRFAFSRLARFGEARDLDLPSRAELAAMLEAYADLARDAGYLARKDCLFTILADRRREPWPGGCTGFGCGAAFNTLALLPDGEVHACRKFPSPLGRLSRTTSLASIWASPAAARYRAGARACAACRLRPACGGCMAVTASLGLDPLQDRDPHCLLDGAR